MMSVKVPTFEGQRSHPACVSFKLGDDSPSSHSTRTSASGVPSTT